MQVKRNLRVIIVVLLIAMISLLILAGCTNNADTDTDTNTNTYEKEDNTKTENNGADYDRYPQSSDYNYYILNTSTKKFHRPDCSHLPSTENAKKIHISRIYTYTNQGYAPCGHCDP